jgi:hypothetical protein
MSSTQAVTLIVREPKEQPSTAPISERAVRHDTTLARWSFETPFDRMRRLKDGWAGRMSERLSDELIDKAQFVYSLLNLSLPDGIERPFVSPGENEFVSFVWNADYPASELRVWIYYDAEEGFEAEYSGKINGKSIMSGSVDNIDAVVTLASNFLEKRNDSKLR